MPITHIMYIDVYLLLDFLGMCFLLILCLMLSLNSNSPEWKKYFTALGIKSNNDYLFSINSDFLISGGVLFVISVPPLEIKPTYYKLMIIYFVAREGYVLIKALDIYSFVLWIASFILSRQIGGMLAYYDFPILIIVMAKLIWYGTCTLIFIKMVTFGYVSKYNLISLIQGKLQKHT